MYADDSTFDCSDQSAKEVLKVLLSSLLPGSTHGLVVNASKSSLMLLGNTKNSDYLQDIILFNVKLEHTFSTKLLGSHIQTDLAYKEYIASVAKSLSSKIGLFLRHHYSTRAATSSCLSLPKPSTELLKEASYIHVYLFGIVYPII